jgi:hypothetical protein
LSCTADTTTLGVCIRCHAARGAAVGAGIR